MMFYLLRSKPIESLAGPRHCTSGVLLYFCARKAPATLLMKKRRAEEERHLKFCRENESGASGAARFNNAKRDREGGSCGHILGVRRCSAFFPWP
jgi:hypothetical protein